ncbi:MAG TPA: ABC transporter substrate-binding protein [Sporichthya sp.]|nr:ABC transporter substrate-binding protein [Sporichthya sp.]
MRRPGSRSLRTVLPITAAVALLVTACGSGSDNNTHDVAESAPMTDTLASPQDTTDSTAQLVRAVADYLDAQASKRGSDAEDKTTKALTAAVAKATASTEPERAPVTQTKQQVNELRAAASYQVASSKKENARIAAQKKGVTDVGVTKDSITMGTVTMHGMALGNVLATPVVNGVKATFASINDRGGVLGRRMSLVDCDDGPGEVSRSKACIRKLVSQDKVFAFLGYSSWASASVHSDLAQYRIPAIGTWAYSQTEWQDSYMFPTHMSMIHEAMAGAQWVKNVIRPKTYGLVCLTSPEMQLACNEVQKILDASGATMVKKLDVGISETSMSAQLLSMRAANPDHIIHYVINPATMVKFMVEAAQQGYYPPKGISGNHLAGEVLGSLFGSHPVNRYWTNTTYKLWGSEFMATMNKYARGNRGLNHHIVQASYTGALIFERAAKAVGPNLTRERLMAQLGNGEVYAADASLDQRFSYAPAERYGQNWNPEMGQGREYMYKYTSTNTVSDPNGTPSGFQPDPDQFVIYTNR